MKSSKRRLCRGSGWMSRGHYEVLGLKPDATVTDKEIRRAYKKLSLRHHPDKNPAENSAKAERNFRELTEAYEVLSDPGKRKAYDAEILSERKVASGPEFHRARSVAEDGCPPAACGRHKATRSTTCWANSSRWRLPKQ